MSPLTHLYLAFSQVSEPIWRIILRKRLKNGKELAERLPEKYGVSPTPRPEGEVVWFHALSVGESLALIPLVERLLQERPSCHVIMTTSTVTSIAALKGAGLSDRVVHVMLPIDTARAVRRFLEHWSPSLAVFAELDFWPRLMVETRKAGTPLVLVNSRMSASSFENRKRTRGLTKDLLSFFSELLLQDDGSVERFVELGAPRHKLRVVGALKAAARPLAVDEGELEVLAGELDAVPVWLAAATHPSEEAGVIESHKTVRAEQPDTLLIVAPRYMDSADALEATAKAAFEKVGRRSRGDVLSAEMQVYIADSIGEMGLWYRLAPVSFVGHSFSDDAGFAGGGKNPYEAMALGSVVVHGPDIADFAETYAGLVKAGASCEVSLLGDLGESISRLLTGASREDMVRAAEGVIADRRVVLDDTWKVLESYLPS